MKNPLYPNILSNRFKGTFVSLSPHLGHLLNKLVGFITSLFGFITLVKPHCEHLYLYGCGVIIAMPSTFLLHHL